MALFDRNGWHGHTEITTSLENIDFNVEMDTIAFNFDTYEIADYASGTIRAKVEKELLERFIQKAYY